MAKINTYTTVTPSLSDKVIGTDASNDSATNNFLISDIVGLIPSATTTVTPALDDKVTILDTSDGNNLKNATVQSIIDLVPTNSTIYTEFTPTLSVPTNCTIGTSAKGIYCQFGNYVNFAIKLQLNFTNINLASVRIQMPLGGFTFANDTFDLIASTDMPNEFDHSWIAPVTATSLAQFNIKPTTSGTKTNVLFSITGYYKRVV